MRLHLLLALLLAGCGNGAEQRMKAAELEKQAEQKVAKAEREGTAKLAQAQKELDGVKAELAATKTKLEEATKSQGASDDAATQVEAATLKARAAYKTLAKYELGELNKDVREVSTRSAKAKPQIKAAVTKLMEHVPAQQKTLAKDLADFDSATIDSLDKVKAKFDKDLAALRTTVRIARAKTP